jgi:hypothetical protein
LAEREARRAAKRTAKENAERLARNDWIPIDGEWGALAIEGGLGQYGRKYQVILRREDFGDHLYPGGQVRFTKVTGGDARIFDLPAQVGPTLSFIVEIHPDAVVGMMICVEGLEVRAHAA